MARIPAVIKLTWLGVLQLLAVFSFDGGWRRHPLDLCVPVLLVNHWHDDRQPVNCTQHACILQNKPALMLCAKWQEKNSGLPFSACSMICLSAFFRLFALSISCSLDRYVLSSDPGSLPLSSWLEPPLSWLGTVPAGTTWMKVQVKTYKTCEIGPGMLLFDGFFCGIPDIIRLLPSICYILRAAGAQHHNITKAAVFNLKTSSHS